MAQLLSPDKKFGFRSDGFVYKVTVDGFLERFRPMTATEWRMFEQANDLLTALQQLATL